MKKIILLFAIALLSIRLVNAQPPVNDLNPEARKIHDYYDSIRQIDLKRGLLSNEEFFEKADLIIEGKKIRFIGYYDAKGSYNPDDLYTVVEFSVRKVFKGDPALTGKTISLVIKGGVVYKPSVSEEEFPEKIRSYALLGMDHGLQISDVNSSILFLMNSDYPEDPDPSKAYPQHKFKPIQHRERASINYWGDGRIGGLNGLVFNNREELYQYMSQFKGVSIPKEPVQPPPYKFSLDGFDPAAKEYIIKRMSRMDPDDLDSVTRRVLIENGAVFKKKLQPNLKTEATNNTLTVSIANQEMTYIDSTTVYVYASAMNPVRTFKNISEEETLDCSNLYLKNCYR